MTSVSKCPNLGHHYLGIRIFIVRKWVIPFLKTSFFKIQEIELWEIKTHISLSKLLAGILVGRRNKKL